MKYTDKLNSLFKNIYIERVLDSILILLVASIITFLIVRIDISITNINILQILSILVCLGLLFIRQFTLRVLPWIGLMGGGILIFLIGYIFPSVLSETSNLILKLWQIVLFPCIWIGLICTYLIRSQWSSQQYLLKVLGFSLCLACGQWICSSVTSDDSPWNIKLTQAINIKSGDPLADLRLNPSVSPELLEREKIRLGLDKPLYKQYTLWLDSLLLKGDLGVTQQGQPVINVVGPPLRNTILLNIFSILGSWLLAIPLGVWAAINKDKLIDKFLLTLSSLSLTLPSFLLSIFILSIGLQLGIGTIGGITSVGFANMAWWQKIFDIISHILLPCVVMIIVGVGMLIRQMRGNLLDVLNEDYIKVAHSRGLHKAIVLWKHAFPNAINPLITLLGFEFAALISGAALTEMILGYPGIGALTLEAARKMDINLIMLMLLLGTFMLLVGNLLADTLMRKVDPRTRSQIND